MKKKPGAGWISLPPKEKKGGYFASNPTRLDKFRYN